MLKEKEVIDNKYEVTKILDDIDLYEVTDLRMRTEWVMKEISMEECCANHTILQKDPETVIGQLEQMKKMNHRFFPKVMEIIRQENTLYVIMEKVSGTVAQNIENKNCSTREVVNWAIQLCDGLEYMEQCTSSQGGVHWKHGMDDLLIEGGSVRVQNFAIDGLRAEGEEKLENIRDIGEFINHMLSGRLKFSGRLKKIVAGCRNTDIEYSEYKELAEKLERYLLDQAKGKRLKKRGMFLAAVLLLVFLVGSAGVNGAKILSKKKLGKSEEKLTAIPTKSAEITQQPKPTPTHAPVTDMPKISPVVTEIPKKAAREKNRQTATAKPKQILPTNAPVITAAPIRQPDTRETIITLKPTTKETEKPNRMDVELEDNNMDIVVKE